jgi:hypothetical protein
MVEFEVYERMHSYVLARLIDPGELCVVDLRKYNIESSSVVLE